MSEKTFEFYKTFYEENRVRLLQYDNLRLHFNQMVGDVLGKDYYNMGMDVYTCDQICCEDITRKARSFWKSIFSSNRNPTQSQPACGLNRQIKGKITMTEENKNENAAAPASQVGRLVRWRLNAIKLYWKIRIFFLALRWIPRINLGDVVVYNGSKYTVCNGNRCGCWRLGDLNNEDDGWVKRTECKKVYSLKNIRRSFRAGRSFYMGYWFDTWCRNGIKDWMRGCNIW